MVMQRRVHIGCVPERVSLLLQTLANFVPKKQAEQKTSTSNDLLTGSFGELAGMVCVCVWETKDTD